MENIKNKLVEMVYDVVRLGRMPLFADCMIRFKEDGEICRAMFKLNCEVIDEEDYVIFFYCSSISQLEYLMREENGEDFVVIDIFNIML